MDDGRNRGTKVRMQQVLLRDGSVYSMQSLDFPPRYRNELTPSLLLERYNRFIRRFTRSLIRPILSPHGLDFTVLGSRLALLRFSPPRYQDSDGECRGDLVITGGVLLQAGQGGKGKFSFIAENLAEGVRVTVELSGFYPLLLGSRAPSRFHKILYRFTQASIHKIVTVRFLIDLYCHLTGEKLTGALERVRVRDGEDI